MLRFLIRVLSNIRYSPRNREILAYDVNTGESVLRDGDVLCTYSEGELTNLFIKGKFKHVGIFAGDGRVVEAIGRGVTSCGFHEFCSTKDKIAILRPKFCDEQESKAAKNHALSQIGVPYDFEFQPNERAFYCAELVWWAYNKATGGNSPFVRRKILGVETVYPSDFYQAHDKFELILELPKS